MKNFKQCIKSILRTFVSKKVVKIYFQKFKKLSCYINDELQSHIGKRDINFQRKKLETLL